VFTGPDVAHGDADRCLLDPDTGWYVPRDPVPAIRGHSGYMADPCMRCSVDRLAGRLRAELEAAAPAPLPLLDPGAQGSL
jgi:hypothetical protein